jgi:glycosyltransferase involved in cell wall biosynthesis
VADFRDEWGANPHLTTQPRSLAGITEHAESAIVSRARHVIVAADYFRLDELDADDPRRVEIVNGVDEADLPVRPIEPRQDRFVVANVGTIYGSVDPTLALNAIAALAARQAIDGDRLEVRLVGSIWEPAFAPPSGIRVVSTGYVEHSQAIREMCAATLLLLYVPSSSLAPSGELFEYLASGRPILCLTHSENLASRLVREWNAGVVADPHDEAEIKLAFLRLWQRWQDNGLPDQTEVRRKTLERYSRRKNAEQLARVLDEAANG